MAPVHGKGARVYANGYDLSSYLTKVQTSGEAETALTTTFGKNSKTRIAGVKDTKLTAEGLFSYSNVAGAQDIDVVMAAALGVENVGWLVGVAGDAVGSRSVGLAAIQNSYEIESPVDGVVSVKAEAEGSLGYGMEGGVFLHSGAASVGTTGNGTNVDHGASTALGLTGFLHVVDVTGASPSLVVKIQHSVDNSVWVDLITFTAVTVDNRAERLEFAVGGTINRHLRAIRTFGGTMTAATFACAASRK